MIHDLSEGTRRVLDASAIAGAIVAGISLAQAALAMSLVAAALSSVLAALRIYDWFSGRKAEG